MPFLRERKKKVVKTKRKNLLGMMGLAGEACKAMPLSAALVS